MPPFRESLRFKLSISLFILIGLGFLAMALTSGHVINARANERVNDIIQQVNGLEGGAGDLAQLMRIREKLSALPQYLVHASGTAAAATALIGLATVLTAAGFLLHVLLFKPLRAISLGLDKTIRAEEKDLTIRLTTHKRDEIGLLSEKFNTFVSTLDQIIQNIGAKTETITAAASEVSGVSDLMNDESSDLNTRSNSVASAAEEMNASMQTMASSSNQASANISMIADAAGQMQGRMAGVAKNCEDAGQISNSARTQAETAAEKVGRLGDAAKEINTVTEMITEIAEQTNLLALNATIEAARAGSAGKGFAVVADEIKRLAAQTAEATQHIRDRIKDIQDSTGEAVSQVGFIAQTIANVDEIVHDISRSVEEQTGTAAEVAANIDQAATGISQVNDSLSQGSQVASEIAADIARVDTVAAGMSDRSQSLSHGARDLDELSVNLQKMISVFKVSSSHLGQARSGTASDKPVADLMPWGPKLATGIEQIDSQHKELVRLVNLLHAAMRQQKGAMAVGRILDELARYTVFHFGFEEKLFDRYGYPDTVKHKKLHENLVEKVSAFQQDFKSGKASVTMDLMQFLKDWLKGHIMKTDMAYTPFLKAHMSKSPAKKVA